MSIAITSSQSSVYVQNTSNSTGGPASANGVNESDASVAASLDPAAYAIWLGVKGDDQQVQANRKEREAFEQLQWSEEDKDISDLKTAANWELAGGICGAASTACEGFSSIDFNTTANGGSTPKGGWQLGSAGFKAGGAICGAIASNDKAGATQDEQQANRDKSMADELKSDTDRSTDDRSKAFDAIRAIHDTQNQTSQAAVIEG